MSLPQYSALHHWYGSRGDRQTSALSTQVDDCSGKGRHGSRIGTLISVIAGWFNLGETNGGGNNGIQPPTLSLAAGQSYSWIARVRRSTTSNWGTQFHVIQGSTSDGGQGNTVGFWNIGHPAESTTGCLNQSHNNFSEGVEAAFFTGGTWVSPGPKNWAVDDPHVVAVTYDAGSTTMRMYVDDLTTPYVTSTSCSPNTGAAVLAWFVWSGGQSWGHEADNVAWFNGARLSSAEVAAMAAYFDIAVSSLSPANAATDVATDAQLIITTSVAPTIGMGNFYIKRVADDSVFQTIAATDTGLVSIVGSTVVIDHDEFDPGHEYYVTRDPFAIAGIGGITSSASWHFATEHAEYEFAAAGLTSAPTLGTGELSMEHTFAIIGITTTPTVGSGELRVEHTFAAQGLTSDARRGAGGLLVEEGGGGGGDGEDDHPDPIGHGIGIRL